MTLIEEQLRREMREAAMQTAESPDLFARIEQSLVADRTRWAVRARVVVAIGGFISIIVAIVLITSDTKEGRLLVHWWILELITTGVLLAIALTLGPFIKRFGKSYAGDVFRANPRTGKSYIVLTDVAYYLIFVAYILFTVTVELPTNWSDMVNAAQLKTELSRVGGILLIMGLLHSVNIVMLPMMGRLLTLNRNLDESADNTPRADLSHATIPAGSWVLRIESAPTQATPPTADRPG